MKKATIFCLLLVLIVIKAAAQNKIFVQISNFENNKGVCKTCLFTSRASFEKGTPFICVPSYVTNETSQASFNNVPDGDYAIFVFHDTNNNGKMDKNFLGIPKEGYGASQNRLPFAAAPLFESNKFSVHASTVNLRIKLRNL